MTTLNVLHISDLHFSSAEMSLHPDDALHLVGEALKGEGPFVLAISGDITTHGTVNGFHEALTSIQKNLRDKLNISKTVVCPGNHDIVQKDRAFSDFNKFSYSLTGSSNQSWNEDQTVRVEEHGDYAFLLVNSSFHGDYSFGRVPIMALETALDTVNGKFPIIIVHHSPISSAYGGRSLGDSYELLALASSRKATAVLHGHVHSDQLITVGSQPTLVAGAAALSFKPDPNMNNQFSVYSFDCGKLSKAWTYRYHVNQNKYSPSEMRIH